MYSLYYSPGACSMASHILLEECEAEFESKLVALAKGEQRTETFRKINPHGKVPALVVGGKVITENVAILPFIASQFPNKYFYPSDSIQLASCVEMTGWLASTVHVAFSSFLHPERPGGGADIGDVALKAISENFRKIYWTCMNEIDAKLTDKQWILGEQYTFVDPYALVFYGWGVRVDMPMADLIHYSAFKERMLERSAVRKILEKENSLLLK